MSAKKLSWFLMPFVFTSTALYDGKCCNRYLRLPDGDAYGSRTTVPN